MDPNQQPVNPVPPTNPGFQPQPTVSAMPDPAAVAAPAVPSPSGAQPYAAPEPQQPAPQMFASSQPYPQQPAAQPYANQAQAYYGSTEQITGSQIASKKNLKKPLLLAGIVVGVLLVGGGIFLALKGGGNPISSIANSVSGNKDVVDRPDGTLDLSKLIDMQTTAKEQTITAKLMQQVNLSDGMTYLVKNVERNYVSPSKYVAAGTGKELIKVNVVVGNRKNSGSIYFSTTTFQAVNSAGGRISAEFVTRDSVPGAFVGTELDPGKQYSAFLLYEVDKDEKVSALTTEEKYENYSTKEKITLKSEVSLQ